MSTVSVNPPKTPVTKGSQGIAAATIPNVCKMPGPPAPFVPVPLPNIGKSGMSPKDYSKDVTFDGNPVGIKGSTFESMGDIASKGTGGGLISANTHGITKFIGPGSMDVKVEGKNVQLLSDPMLNNCGPGGSPPNSATLVGVIQATGSVTYVEAGKCPVCNKDHGAFEESGRTQLDAETLSKKFHARVRTAPGSYSTMLAVVQCRTCSKKYGDHSSGTLEEFTGAADSAGILRPPSTGSLANREGGPLPRRLALARRNRVIAAMTARIGNNAQRVAQMADRRSDLSSDGQGPTAYPLGACGGQGALVFALDRGALPKAMTERFYSKESGTTFPIVHDVVNKDGVRSRNVQRGFKSGESVPPCKTCELVVPVLICPEPEYQCRCR